MSFIYIFPGKRVCFILFGMFRGKAGNSATSRSTQYFIMGENYDLNRF